MATPPARLQGEGVKAQARVELSNAVRSLIKALSVLREAGSEESQAIISALKSLSRVTPDVDEGVSQSEIKSLLAGADTAKPGPGVPSGAGPAPAGVGPMGPRPMAVAGMPFGMNQGVPAPTPGMM